MNTKKNISLENASKVCQCMKEQITLNKNQLNTSKLQTKQKLKIKMENLSLLIKYDIYQYVSKNMG